jgi:large subunit ribosomal protein L21
LIRIVDATALRDKLLFNPVQKFYGSGYPATTDNTKGLAIKLRHFVILRHFDSLRQVFFVKFLSKKYPKNFKKDLHFGILRIYCGFLMRAVIAIQGKQFAVNEGDILIVDRCVGYKGGDSVEISDVLVLGEGETAKVGTPTVAGASVRTRVLENKRAKKVLIYKKKRRKGYQRKRGHRQELSVLRVEKIEA